MLPGTHLLVNLLEPDIHKWIPNFISYTCKIIGIIVAWNIQVVITAFYSAVRGGLSHVPFLHVASPLGCVWRGGRSHQRMSRPPRHPLM